MIAHPVTNETNLLLQAVEKWRRAYNPSRVERVRDLAARCDDLGLPPDERVILRMELRCLMDRFSTDLSERDAVVQLWLRTWDLFEEFAPGDPVFAMFSRDDLVDEIIRDYTDADDDDDTKDFFERSTN